MKKLTMFWMGVFYLLVLYGVLSRFRTDDHQRTSIIVLKLPRSGSSWFTELLNDIPSYYISKEIVQTSDVGHFSLNEIEHHLARALTTPVGKIQSMNTYTLLWMFMRSSQRYFEDYVFHKSMKWWNDLEAIGFSVNPEHCEDLDWSRVTAQSHAKTKLIVYRRSNIVKSVVSGHFGKLTKSMCGSANIRTNSHGACSIPKTLNMTLPEFVKELEEYQTRYDTLSATVSQKEGLNTLPTMNVYYEEIQANRDKVLQSIIRFNRIPNSQTAPTTGANPIVDSESTVITAATTTSILSDISATAPVKATKKSGGVWMKRSSEDLSEVLKHFTLINDSLAAVPECSCFHQQLNEKGFKVFFQSCSVVNPLEVCFKKLKAVQLEPPVNTVVSRR